MNYHPNLFVRNIGNASIVKVYDLLKGLDFGKIDHLKIDTIQEEKCVFVKMRSWNLELTTATRIKLQEGKPLSIYYTEKDYWKVFSFENRFIEELEREQRELEQRELEQRELQERELEKLEQEKYQEYNIPLNISLDYGYSKEIYPTLISKYTLLLQKYKTQ